MVAVQVAAVFVYVLSEVAAPTGVDDGVPAPSPRPRRQARHGGDEAGRLLRQPGRGVWVEVLSRAQRQVIFLTETLSVLLSYVVRVTKAFCPLRNPGLYPLTEPVTVPAVISLASTDTPLGQPSGAVTLI